MTPMGENEKPWEPKFVQITASVLQNGEGDKEENLYALDASGGVWAYNFAIGRWQAMPKTRDCDEHPKAETWEPKKEG